jgi:hypothetical protein
MGTAMASLYHIISFVRGDGAEFETHGTDEVDWNSFKGCGQVR